MVRPFCGEMEDPAFDANYEFYDDADEDDFEADSDGNNNYNFEFNGQDEEENDTAGLIMKEGDLLEDALTPPVPANEHERLKALHSLQILDATDPFFDMITQTVKRTFRTAIASISLIDAERIWSIGGFSQFLGTPRVLAFSSWLAALPSNGHIVIPDTHNDPRTRGNRYAHGAGGLRFFAGVPLSMGDNLIIGSLSLADTQPWPEDKFSLSDIALLKDFAAIIMERIASRSQTIKATSIAGGALQQLPALHAGLNALSDSLIIWDSATTRVLYANTAFLKLTGYSQSYVLHKQGLSFMYGNDTNEGVINLLNNTFGLFASAAAVPASTIDTVLNIHDGTPIWAQIHITKNEMTPDILLGVITDMEKKTETSRAHEEAIRTTMEMKRCKEEFLANMSHEIRTPLNGIVTTAALLSEAQDQLPETAQPIVKQLQSLSHVLFDTTEKMIGDTLRGGAISARRAYHDLVHLQELVHRCVIAVHERAKPKNVVLQQHVDAAAPSFVWTDMDKMQKLIMLVLVTAVTHAAEGAQINIHISAVQGLPVHRKGSTNMRREHSTSKIETTTTPTTSRLSATTTTPASTASTTTSSSSPSLAKPVLLQASNSFTTSKTRRARRAMHTILMRVLISAHNGSPDHPTKSASVIHTLAATRKLARELGGDAFIERTKHNNNSDSSKSRSQLGKLLSCTMRVKGSTPKEQKAEMGLSHSMVTPTRRRGSRPNISLLQRC